MTLTLPAQLIVAVFLENFEQDERVKFEKQKEEWTHRQSRLQSHEGTFAVVGVLPELHNWMKKARVWVRVRVTFRVTVRVRVRVRVRFGVRVGVRVGSRVRVGVKVRVRVGVRVRVRVGIRVRVRVNARVRVRVRVRVPSWAAQLDETGLVYR